MSQSVQIVKANGQREAFSSKKLLRSLRRSGATPVVAERVLQEILGILHDGMQTREIYRKAFQILRSKETLPVAHRYNLRNAIMELGPDGFAFELLVGEIFRELGYVTRVGTIVQGWCIEHEVDISARKGHLHVLAECKFHNRTGYKTDLKVALYVRERFQDIEKGHEHHNAEGSREHEGWLITNTKLTSKAIKYSECVGQRVVGWGYPVRGNGNLEDLIMQTNIHPITALTSLSKHQKKQLIQDRIIICKSIERQPDVLVQIGVNESKVASVLREITSLRETSLSSKYDT
jgi:hypothetical protein